MSCQVLSACLVPTPNSKKVLQQPSHRILRYMHGALNVDKKKLIAQFGWKLRDERFEPNQSMIEHYLPNKNENATVAQIPTFTQLNTPQPLRGEERARIWRWVSGRTRVHGAGPRRTRRGFASCGTERLSSRLTVYAWLRKLRQFPPNRMIWHFGSGC